VRGDGTTVQVRLFEYKQFGTDLNRLTAIFFSCICPFGSKLIPWQARASALPMDKTDTDRSRCMKVHATWAYGRVFFRACRYVHCISLEMLACYNSRTTGTRTRLSRISPILSRKIMMR
jgi:hypothetical protein